MRVGRLDIVDDDGEMLEAGLVGREHVVVGRFALSDLDSLLAQREALRRRDRVERAPVEIAGARRGRRSAAADGRSACSTPQ